MLRDSGDSEPTRRGFLAALAAGSTPFVTGCIDDLRDDDGSDGTPEPVSDGTPATPELSQLEEFDTVVDAVETGADPTGEEPITWLIEEEATDDTGLLFPEGRYALGNVELQDLSNFGLVGTGEATAVLVPAGSADELDDPWIDISGVSDFLLRDLDFDFTWEGYAGAMSVSAEGDFAVRNVTVDGTYDVDTHGFLFDVRSADHAGLVENVTAVGAREDGLDTIGIYVGEEHAGELTFRECHIERFSNNGLYASSPGNHSREESSEGQDGAVHVIGGVYRNNNISNVRLGSTGSSVRDVSILVDEEPPRHPNGLNVRGIWLRGTTDHVVENCTVTYDADAAMGDGAIIIDEHTGRSAIQGTHVHVERDDVSPIWALAPTEAVRETGPTGPVFEDVTVTSSASGDEGIEIVGRDGTVLRHCCLHTTESTRHGVVFRDSYGCSVRDTTISVTGQPIVIERGHATVADTSMSTGEQVDVSDGPCS